jgi:hypothetical protein
MNTRHKQAIGATFVLILLGLVVLITGVKWLTVLIPAATLVWYAASPRMRSGRN